MVDACRHVVRDGRTVVSLASRPVLFALARALAEAWPEDVSRETLVARAFGARHADESHRARLRVEIGRLRAALRPLAGVSATDRGFVLAPLGGRDAAVLAPPVDEEHAEVLALLADGEAWSSSALALALGVSQRTVQRALDALAAAGKVAVARPRTGAPLADAAAAGFRDDLVTPGCRCRAPRLGAMKTKRPPRSSASTAPSPASTACTASRSTAATSGSPPATG